MTKTMAMIAVVLCALVVASFSQTASATSASYYKGYNKPYCSDITTKSYTAYQGYTRYQGIPHSQRIRRSPPVQPMRRFQSMGRFQPMGRF